MMPISELLIYSMCRQYETGECTRSGFCNFMHPKHLSRDMRKELYDWMYKEHPEYL